ncbi:ATP-binding protein [Natranaerobius trueperi]|uniref:YhaN AAA domain-containing protein n=1 Tax=Natranaerobius trueperi TaxID=759412 RepID=A0A226C0Q5_9FIRM|nr:AAA family ATPase [Natranaerobius trueperi]OWZ84622.1 hypothetical protein CDO51_02355 [Natranaerobius trueperi]
MKIKQIYIDKFGPLSEQQYQLTDGFNLFFGPNERGKTMLLDAMIKMLSFKYGIGATIKREFSDIPIRVEEQPQGKIKLLYKGDEFYLPDNNLPEYLDLPKQTFRNLFIIRNSDLSQKMNTSSNKVDFYSSMISHLTGMKNMEIDHSIKNIEGVTQINKKELLFTNNIKQDIEKIQEIKYKNTRQNNYLNDRIENAKALLERIDEFKKQVYEQRLDSIEIELANIEGERDDLIQALRELDLLEEIYRYKFVKDEIKDLENNLDNLEKLSTINKADLDKWHYAEVNIKELTREIDNLDKEISDKTRKKEQVYNDLNKNGEQLKLLKENKDQIDRLDFTVVETLYKDLSRLTTTVNSLKPVSILTIIAFLISFLGTYFFQNFWFISMTTLLFVATGLFLRPSIILAIKKGKFNYELENLNATLAKYSLHSRELPELKNKVQAFYEEYSKIENDFFEAKDIKRKLDLEIDTLLNQKEKNKQKINEYDKEIEKIRRKSFLNDKNDYQTKLQLKVECEKNIEKSHQKLSNIFGDESYYLEDLKNRLLEAFYDLETKYTSLHDDKFIEPNMFEKADLLRRKFDLKDENYLAIRKMVELEKKRLNEKKVQLENMRDEKRNKMETFLYQLKEFGKKSFEIVLPSNEEDKQLLKSPQTLEGLVAIENIVKSFQENKRKEKGLAGMAIRILEKIRTKEEKKVQNLFNKETRVADYFNKITSGMYDQVSFDQNKKTFYTRRHDGKLLNINNLSGGAYDQLYLSIRLAFGEKVLPQKGFFIFDDPFIKADYNRLCNQIKLLMEVCQSGWQVLFFSSKKETKEALDKYIEKNQVNLIEV